MKSSSLISLLVVLALCIPIAFSNPARQQAGNAQVINVTAKKEFDPPTIRVKQGTRVQLKITATDHAHGMKLSETPNGDKTAKPGLFFTSPQDCLKIEEGKTETLEFIAQNPGTYPFRCCVHCGWHHGAMKGELIVEP